jgi:Holliday junction DNA helicase RuvA
MYDYLKGTLIHLEEEILTLDVHGVGYKIFTPITKDLSLHTEITLYTHLLYREPEFVLFGFLTRNLRNLFLTLVSISGVGPKTALNLLSHLTLETLQTAILTQNMTTLSSVPGIGKKTAERLLLELKSKLNQFPASYDPAPTLFNDALTALTNLGYSPSHSQKVLTDTLKALPPNTTLSNVISAALKVISIRN